MFAVIATYLDSLDTSLQFTGFSRVCVGRQVGHVVAAIAEWSHVSVNWWNVRGVGVRGEGYHEESRILLQNIARGKPHGLRTVVSFASFGGTSRTGARFPEILHGVVCTPGQTRSWGSAWREVEDLMDYSTKQDGSSHKGCAGPQGRR